MQEHSESTTADSCRSSWSSWRSLVAAVFFCWLPNSGLAQSLPGETGSIQMLAEGPHSTVRLRLPEIFHEMKSDAIGVEFEIEKDWHIYWENPGDSGEEPRFDFSSSRGIVLSTPQFPIPKRIAAGPFTNFGFESRPGQPVFVRVPAKVSKDSRFDFADVVLDLTYLVCKEECVPAEVKLRGRVPIRAVDSEALVDVPFRPQEFPPLKGKGSRDEPLSATWKIDASGRLGFLLEDLNFSGDPSSLEFFPLANFRALHGSRGHFTMEMGASKSGPKSQGVRVALDLDPSLAVPEQTTLLEGLVVDRATGKASWVRLDSRSAVDWIGVVRYVSLAFLGGLILNLMPCVFPVVSLKVLSFLSEARGNRLETKWHALLYALGVLTSLWVLLAILLAIRSAGSAAGWGFQLQDPIFLFGLFATFLFLGFNLLGLFEIQYSGPGSLQNLMMLRGRLGSFFTGLLTTLVATPCSAPFMGVAIGAALASGSFEATLVFTSLGLGLASPYVALGFFPTLLEWLPRPGAWMDRFKQLLAFPLFLTAVWLLWVLSQSGTMAAIVLIVGWSVFAGFYIWARHFNLSHLKWLALMILIVGFFMIAKILDDPAVAGPSNNSEISTTWEPYSESKLQAALSKGESVLVDYTASWCVTCQVNKKLVLDTDRAQSLFQEAQVRLIRADWTKRDSEVSNALSRLGRQSVPVYAFYRNGGRTPEILPELLTFEILENAIRK